MYWTFDNRLDFGRNHIRTILLLYNIPVFRSHVVVLRYIFNWSGGSRGIWRFKYCTFLAGGGCATSIGACWLRYHRPFGRCCVVEKCIWTSPIDVTTTLRFSKTYLLSPLHPRKVDNDFYETFPYAQYSNGWISITLRRCCDFPEKKKMFGSMELGKNPRFVVRIHKQNIVW
jgi:hypothetical protein